MPRTNEVYGGNTGLRPRTGPCRSFAFVVLEALFALTWIETGFVDFSRSFFAPWPAPILARSRRRRRASRRRGSEFSARERIARNASSWNPRVAGAWRKSVAAEARLLRVFKASEVRPTREIGFPLCFIRLDACAIGGEGSGRRRVGRPKGGKRRGGGWEMGHGMYWAGGTGEWKGGFHSGLSRAYRRAEPWKTEISEKLIGRQQKEMEGFLDYKQIVEKSTWVKSAVCQWLDATGLWLDAVIDLETVGGSSQGFVESGFVRVRIKTRPGKDVGRLVFFLSFESASSRGESVGSRRQVLASLSEVTCVWPLLDPKRPTVSVETAKGTKRRRPIKVAFPSETEMEDWLAQLGYGVMQVRGQTESPKKNAVWATTGRGDVFVWDPPEDPSAAVPEDDPDRATKMYWRQIGGHLLKVETSPAGVVWGLGYDGTCWAYTRGYGGEPWKSGYISFYTHYLLLKTSGLRLPCHMAKVLREELHSSESERNDSLCDENFRVPGIHAREDDHVLTAQHQMELQTSSRYLIHENDDAWMTGSIDYPGLLGLCCVLDEGMYAAWFPGYAAAKGFICTRQTHYKPMIADNDWEKELDHLGFELGNRSSRTEKEALIGPSREPGGEKSTVNGLFVQVHADTVRLRQQLESSLEEGRSVFDWENARHQDLQVIGDTLKP
ncbi:unnamed protein product [Darwinula stevensoni]|uniref:Uncharacterized protein n=1 Tax=Darwinula stevensoni TaxID=69355 RepID=A0A7R9FSW8_9CRUS|nr:unnamed protein product [Darwinula stevensoni]CAG0904367.1 unnamed protein product [Darwinula stevensoni]